MGDQLKCPCCGSFMDRGHLSAGGYRIIWTPKDRRHSNILGPGDAVVQRGRLFSALLDNVGSRPQDRDDRNAVCGYIRELFPA